VGPEIWQTAYWRKMGSFTTDFYVETHLILDTKLQYTLLREEYYTTVTCVVGNEVALFSTG
jgi:hypothetical protein